ncbi:uncharacterized protein G2W53_019907 [Senna tora]|uniref:Uncharacterized protein n=1 Tax=Senna tora TaxID=362788 RepID=A0A834TV39_9FABA|nr:uncharacterized protein G2W53_019907 [Senna tora]
MNEARKDGADVTEPKLGALRHCVAGTITGKLLSSNKPLGYQIEVNKCSISGKEEQFFISISFKSASNDEEFMVGLYFARVSA